MKPFTITNEDDGIRLDRWVKRHMPGITHGMLEKGLRKGWVKLDRKKTTASARLEEGQVIEFAESLVAQGASAAPQHSKTSTISDADAKMIKKAVIYEDAELIAINKPAGLAVQGGSGQTKSVDALARALVGDGEIVPKLVHRLDKDTSGVLILAKTAKAATSMSRMFAGKQVEKEYVALVVGLPKPRQGRIDMPLIKTVRGKNSMIEKVDIDFDDGKDAVTEYEVISNAGQKYAWVKLKPITGRTHQLRVHMASIGHPIVGDGKYGGAEAFIRGGGIAEKLHLHAAQITLPRSGKRSEVRRPSEPSAREAVSHARAGGEHGDRKIVIQAPLPAHMQQSKDLIG